ncbi:MAG: OmpA family protein [Deltaproteobacteria bacterium]|nr:OmpA family protein [Deltaproteobacteria bacterium]MBW2685116.1 OmpA family protein [Deltaproteobacteria bacterium]
MRGAWVAALVLIALVVVAGGPLPLSSVAGAQEATLSDGGMDLHLFRPAVDTRGYFSVNGTEVMPHKEFSFGLVLDAGFGILRYNGFVNDPDNTVAADASRQNRIAKQAFTGTFMFNFGLIDRLVIGIQLPITFFRGNSVQTPDRLPGGSCSGATSAGCLYNYQANGLRSQGVGDLTIHAKARLLNLGESPVGIAVTLRAGFPTAKTSQFAGEPGFSLWPTAVLEFQPIEKIRLALEGGYRWNSQQGASFIWDGRSEPSGLGDPLANAVDPVDQGTGNRFTYNDLITFGFGSSFRIARSLDFIIEFYGTKIAQEIGTKGTLSMEALGGFKYFVTNKSFLYFAAGAGIPKTGFQAADVRAVIAFMYEPAVGDRDKDGIPDDDDGCPDDPEDKDGFEDRDGCPDLDNDGDGILDVDDACPLVKEDYDGDRDEDGCPEGREGDRDGDGIPDNVDDCPDEPEDFDGFQDEDGCPDPDNDGDGIPDEKDLCPNDPEDFDGFEDEDGCPDVDNDADRILDVDDACPNDPETYNGNEDEDGCPDKGLVILEDTQITILEKVYFETDSAIIKSRSFALLDAVAATLNASPQITLVEIQGHADERGSDKYNIKLTRARAASVMNALIERGVIKSRLRSGGYGERCPVDPKHTARAWEKNRRVEFKIIETDAGPTGVEVTCPRGRSLVPR